VSDVRCKCGHYLSDHIVPKGRGAIISVPDCPMCGAPMVRIDDRTVTCSELCIWTGPQDDRDRIKPLLKTLLIFQNTDESKGRRKSELERIHQEHSTKLIQNRIRWQKAAMDTLGPLKELGDLESGEEE